MIYQKKENKLVALTTNSIKEGPTDITNKFTGLHSSSIIRYERDGRMITLWGYIQTSSAVAANGELDIITGIPNEIRPYSDVGFTIPNASDQKQWAGVLIIGKVNDKITLRNGATSSSFFYTTFCVTYPAAEE